MPRPEGSLRVIHLLSDSTGNLAQHMVTALLTQFPPHVGQTSYEALAHVEQELAFSRALFMRRGWPMLDVTHLAVEETAAKVIELLSLSEQKVP